MISIQTKTHVGADGTLSVQVPTTLRETDVEVLLVFQPLPTPVEKPVLEAPRWPPGFFEATFGSLRDTPIERGPQGEYEVREALECWSTRIGNPGLGGGKQMGAAREQGTAKEKP